MSFYKTMGFSKNEQPSLIFKKIFFFDIFDTYFDVCNNDKYNFNKYFVMVFYENTVVNDLFLRLIKMDVC